MRVAVLAITTFAVVATACGSDSRTGGAAQPAEDTPEFVTTNGDEVPVHPLAEPVSETSTENGVTARSFEVRNVSEAQLFEWYREQMDGWTLAEEPARTGPSSTASMRAIWAREGKRLVVTTSPAPTLSGDEPRLQYSLSLEA